MAKLEIKKVETVYVLTMTEAEAQELRDLLGDGIGGDSLHKVGLRDMYDRLAEELDHRRSWKKVAEIY